MRSEYDVARAVNTYSDMMCRICCCYLKSKSDTEDIVQNVFLKYMLYDGSFESSEHEKAWLIRVCRNACKDHLKSIFRRRTVSLEEIAERTAGESSEHSEVLRAVLSLPVKYRDVIYLHYYEQYSGAQIAKILKCRESTVFSLLSRGRAMLKDRLGGEMDG